MTPESQLVYNNPGSCKLAYNNPAMQTHVHRLYGSRHERLGDTGALDTRASLSIVLNGQTSLRRPASIWLTLGFKANSLRLPTLLEPIMSVFEPAAGVGLSKLPLQCLLRCQ
jgi:hypothetical protein